MNERALLRRADANLYAWCKRRDAVFGLYRAWHREEARAVWANLKVFWRAVRYGTE